MSKIENALKALIQVILLIGLVVGMIALFRLVSSGTSIPPLSSINDVTQPYPPPGTGTPLLEQTQTMTEPEYPSLINTGTPQATWTPIPTMTPQPTTTPRPGPTKPAVPLPTLRSDPSGVIWYTTREMAQDLGTPEVRGRSFEIHALKVNAQAKIIEDPQLNALVGQLNSILRNSAGSVYPSPNRRYLMLLVPLEASSLPYLYDRVDHKGTFLFEDFGGGRFFGWHPDGQRFLFWVEGVALWLVDAETLESTTLSMNRQSYLQGAASSPDGLSVAFVAENSWQQGGEWPGYALWMVSAAGGDAKPIFDSGPQSYLSPTAWSPDGTRLVYYGDCSGQQGEADSPTAGPLCLLDLRTGERKALIMPFAGADPVWSPDGRYIAGVGLTPGKEFCNRGFTSIAEEEACFYGNYRIYIENLDLNEVIQLTEGISPTWSPDGSMLAFLSNSSGAPEIWTIQLDGSNKKRLTASGQSKSYRLVWFSEAD